MRPRNTLVAGGAALLVLIGGLAVSERGVTGTIEHQWDDFTSVKSNDQADPSRVLRSNSGNRWVWWKEAVGAFSVSPSRGGARGPSRSSTAGTARTTSRCASRTACGSSSWPRLESSARPGGWPRPARLGGRPPAAAREGRERRYVAALACAALAWGVHMWFDWDSDIPGVTLPLLIFLGVLAARPLGAPDAVEAVPPPDDVRARGPARCGAARRRADPRGARHVRVPALAGDDKAAEANLLSTVRDERVLAEEAKRADEAMQLNPLSIEPVAARRDRPEARPLRGGRGPGRGGGRPPARESGGLAARVRRPELRRRRARADRQRSAGARAGPARGPSRSTRSRGRRRPVGERDGDAARGQVLPATAPPVGPPAPDARPLIGPPRPASAGGHSPTAGRRQRSDAKSAPIRP